MFKNKIAYKCFIIVVVLFIALTSVSANTAQYSNKIILPDTNLYINADINSEVVAVMPQNAVVTPDGDAFYVGEYSWQRIIYNTITGYVMSGDLYQSRDIENYTIEHGKARSAKMGEDINMYISNDINSTIACVIHDGEEFDIITTKIDYGDFELVEYNDNQYFALKANVTTSLSYNETIALIIGCSAAGVLIVLIITIILLKHKKLYKDSI